MKKKIAEKRLKFLSWQCDLPDIIWWALSRMADFGCWLSRCCNNLATARAKRTDRKITRKVAKIDTIGERYNILY